MAQICEVTENTKRGARGFILPPSMVLGNPQEHVLLPATIGELDRLGLRPREVALDGGFQGRVIEEALTGLAPDRVFIAAWRATALVPKAASATSNANTDSPDPGSRASTEHEPWNAWAIATYNLDTLAIRST